MKKCKVCERHLLMKAEGMCQNCWSKHKYRNNPEFFLRVRFSHINQRCNNPNQENYSTYKNKLKCTREEFLSKFRNCRIFLRLYKEWQESNFDSKYSPSVDRIDPKGNYSLANMQFLTHSENTCKDTKKEIVVLTLDNKYIKTFSSLAETHRTLNIARSGIYKVCNGKRNHAGGYKFMYRTDYEKL